jgi:hypothetical protein
MADTTLATETCWPHEGGCGSATGDAHEPWCPTNASNWDPDWSHPPFAPSHTPAHCPDL